MDKTPRALLSSRIPMFGDAYIRLRAQAGTALFSLVRLAQEFDAPAEVLAEVRQLQDGLREPFLFVTLGDAKAGKSSLFNALFGRDFTDAPDSTREITVYRYAAESRDAEPAAGVAERWRPLNFLREFLLVDTPPLDLRAEVAPELAPFVAGADLLLFVFAAANIEADRAWRLLQRLDEQRLKRLVFVVDTRGESTPDMAAKQLRQTMLKHLSQPRPIFPIDTQRALAARIVGDEAGLPATGIDLLEEFIDREVAGGLTRMAPVNFARGRAREILQQLSAAPREAVQGAARDAGRLDALHHFIEERKDRSLRQMGGILWSLTQALEHAQKRGEETICDHFTLPALVRLGRGWRQALDTRVEIWLHDAIRLQIDDALEATGADHRAVWEELETQRRRAFPAAGPTPPDFAVARDHLRAQLDAAIEVHALGEGFEQRMRALFFRAAVCMRVAVFSVGGSIVLVAFAAVARPSPFPQAFGGALLVLFLCGLALLLWQSRLLAEFRRFATVRRETFIGAVEDHLRAEIDHFAEDLADSLGPLEMECAARRRAHEPMLARAAQLDELFAKSDARPAAAS